MNDGMERLQRALLVMCGFCFGGLVTHIIQCMLEEDYIFMAVGTIAPFVGIVHGWCCWMEIFI